MTKEEFLEAFDSKNREFEMFTKAGNRKAQSITRQAIKKIFGGKRITREELQDFVGLKIAKAYLNEKTSEIMDSEPPYHIKHYINKACELVGYNFDFDRWDITDKVWGHVEALKK
jgi:hypothetical protein